MDDGWELIPNEHGGWQTWAPLAGAVVMLGAAVASHQEKTKKLDDPIHATNLQQEVFAKEKQKLGFSREQALACCTVAAGAAITVPFVLRSSFGRLRGVMPALVPCVKDVQACRGASPRLMHTDAQQAGKELPRLPWPTDIRFTQLVPPFMRPSKDKPARSESEQISMREHLQKKLPEFRITTNVFRVLKTHDDFFPPKGSSVELDYSKLAQRLLNGLKVSQPWDPLMDRLHSCSQFEKDFAGMMPGPSVFFQWLLSMAEQDVERKLVSLQVERNPVPLWSRFPERGFSQHLFWSMPELPVLLSLKFTDAPLGASFLNSLLFATDFETGTALSGDVQIQFDTDFKRPGRGFAVADAHGIIDGEFLAAIQRKFQFCVVHVPYDKLVQEEELLQLEESASLHDILEAFGGKSNLIILARDSPDGPDGRVRSISDHKWSDQASIFTVPDMTIDVTSNRRHATKLRGLIMDCMAPRLAYDPSTEDYDIKRAEGGIFSKQNMAELAGLQTHNHNALKSFMTIPECSFLQMCPLHWKSCRLAKDLKSSEAHDDRRQMHKTMLELDEIKHRMQQLHLSEPMTRFADLFVANPRLVFEYSKQVGGKSISMALQEMMLFISHGSLEKALVQQIQTAFADAIWDGEPFELIDGEHLYFHLNFLQGLLARLLPRMAGKAFVVESTLGPQSSGKSTLKNRSNHDVVRPGFVRSCRHQYPVQHE